MRTLVFFKKFKRQLLEPHPSERHPGHFLTFLEMSNLVKLPEEQRSELGKCQICPNRSFTSVTEQTRHRKMLHAEAKRDDVAPGPSKHTCNYKIGGNVCGEIFKSQHLLYKHKEELGHKRVRSETAKNQLVESQTKRKKQEEERR